MNFSAYHQQAITLLANAYSEDFAKFVQSNDEYLNVIQELAGDYINRQIPIVDNEAEYDLSLELCGTLSVQGIKNNGV